MATQGISGVGLAMATGGALLAYAGFTGRNPLQALRDVTSGSPTGVARTNAQLVTTRGSGGIYVSTGAGIGSGAALVDAAKKYLGVPYVWGGTDRNGLDCSGLVVVAFQDAYGVTPPRTTWGQEPWKELVTVQTPAPGDLVFWPDHVAIFVGDGKVIHAPRTGKPVQIVPMDQAGPVGTSISSIGRYKGIIKGESEEKLQPSFDPPNLKQV